MLGGHSCQFSMAPSYGNERFYHETEWEPQEERSSSPSYAHGLYPGETEGY